ncbi:hypothetical protein [Vulcanisaeta sp. JCM 16159]|uniref:hypothetical protein n=1 Tax=Vulcanisaeta sp. JCM 16159 TaxID=1295371 RepID=UPI0006D18A56|nr:hypothetical protein [Vulcanisaeta sp. JCM 16159]
MIGGTRPKADLRGISSDVVIIDAHGNADLLWQEPYWRDNTMFAAYLLAEANREFEVDVKILDYIRRYKAKTGPPVSITKLC